MSSWLGLALTLLSRGLGSPDVVPSSIQGLDSRWAADSCAGCHKDLGAGVQIWFVSTSSCDSCVRLDFFSFCCEESRSILGFLHAHPQPWYSHGKVSPHGPLETWGCRHPMVPSTQSGMGSSFLTHGSPKLCTLQGQTSSDLEPLRSPFSLGEDTF